MIVTTDSTNIVNGKVKAYKPPKTAMNPTVIHDNKNAPRAFENDSNDFLARKLIHNHALIARTNKIGIPKIIRMKAIPLDEAALECHTSVLTIRSSARTVTL